MSLGNPTEALFQVEGNLALYANLFVNHAGPAMVIQQHHGVVRRKPLPGCSPSRASTPDPPKPKSTQR